MLRTRLLLTIFVTVFSSIGLAAPGTGWHAAATIPIVIFSALAALSGLTVLGCTLFKARIAPDGSVCFDANHPIHWFNIANLKDGTSLCGTTWGTFLPITYVSVLCVFVVGLLFSIGKATYKGQGMEFLKVLGVVAVIVVVLAGIAQLAQLLSPQWLKDFFNKYGGAIFLGIIGIALLLMVFVGLPSAMINEAAKKGQEVTYGGALLTELLYTLAGVAGIAAIVGLVWAGFKFLPLLADTAFGRFIKANFCPVVRTCPVGDDCNPATPQTA